MFGSRDQLGFTADELDTSAANDRRRRINSDELTTVRNGMLIINISMMVILVPVFAAILLSALRSEDPERWAHFWILTAVLLIVALTIEVVVLMRLLGSHSDSEGVFTGDERA